MKFPIEFWLKHPDYVGIEISSFGRVRSAKGCYYKSFPNNNGYLQVHFNINGESFHKLVHRLVAQAFIPNPNNLPQVNHKHGDRTNNNVSNLEWCDNIYNSQYRDKFGISSVKLLGHPVFAVNLITLEVSWYPSQREASRILGLHQSNINAVVKGRLKTDWRLLVYRIR